MKNRKKYTDKFKKKVVDELLEGATNSALTKKYKVGSSMIYSWKKKFVGDKKSIPTIPSTIKDAIIFLNQANQEIMDEIKKGNKNALSKSNLYLLLALDSLTKK